MTYALWIVQVLPALLFLLAGGTKLILSPDAPAAMGTPNQVALPGLFVRFIAAMFPARRADIKDVHLYITSYNEFTPSSKKFGRRTLARPLLY
jgi:hypothetical protein